MFRIRINEDVGVTFVLVGIYRKGWELLILIVLLVSYGFFFLLGFFYWILLRKKDFKD